MEGQVCVGPRPLLCRGRNAGVRSMAPAQEMWEKFVGSLAGWVIVRVRHHGPLRLAHIPWVSVACVRQVDAFHAGVPDRQALVECVARSRFVGLYEGVLLGKVGSSRVVAVDGRFLSRWFAAPRRVLR